MWNVSDILLDTCFIATILDWTVFGLSTLDSILDFIFTFVFVLHSVYFIWKLFIWLAVWIDWLVCTKSIDWLIGHWSKCIVLTLCSFYSIYIFICFMLSLLFCIYIIKSFCLFVCLFLVLVTHLFYLFHCSCCGYFICFTYGWLFFGLCHQYLLAPCN